MNIQEFRQKYPGYDDLSDLQLAQAVHTKYYNDIDFDKFATAFGVSPEVKQEGAIKTFADEYAKSVYRGFLGAGASLIGTAEWAIPGKQESLIRAKENIQTFEERYKPTHEGAAAWTGKVIGEAIPSMGLALAGGTAAGAVSKLFGASAKVVGIAQKLGAAGIGFALEGDAAYDAAMQSGATEAQANTERVLVGSINAAIEAFQIDRLMKSSGVGSASIKTFAKAVRDRAWTLAGKQIQNFTGEILKTALSEGIEEALQEGVSVSIPAGMRKDYPKKPDGSVDWKAILTRIGEAGLGGAVAGGTLGIGTSLIKSTPSIAAPSVQEMQKTADAIKNSNLSETEKVHLLRELDKNLEPLTTSEEVPQFAPQELTKAEQFRNKFDTIAAEIKPLAKEEKKTISQRRAERFNEFRNILDSTQDKRQGITMAKQALSGRLKQDFPELRDKLSTQDITDAYGAITTSKSMSEGDVLNASEGLEKVMDGVIPAKHEMNALRKAGLLSQQAMQDILKHRSFMQKAWGEFKDISLAPWSLLTSMDISGAGRQGWKILFSNWFNPKIGYFAGPKLWARSVGRAYRMFASEKYYNYAKLRRQTHPMYEQAVKYGYEETDLDYGDKKEELYASRLVSKIPGLRASGRSYIGVLNELRFGAITQGLELMEGTGATAQMKRDWVQTVNDLTGRGKLPKAVEKFQNTTLAFFAPKLLTAQIRSVTDLATMSSPARKMLAGTLIKFALLTAAVLYFLDGDDKDKIDVEWNPLSTDFLKVRHGKTRVDITGGYQPLLRTLFQLATGKKKSTETGVIYDAERKEIVARFLQSKLSPVVGLGVDLWSGENFRGDKLEFTPKGTLEQLYERATPLFIQDMIDAARLQGLSTMLATAPLAFHGMGLQTYPTTLTQDTKQFKDDLARQYFGTTWDELGQDAQKELRLYHPTIELKEAEAKIDRDDFDFTAQQREEADKVGRAVTKKLDKNIQKELRVLIMDAGDISRSIGSGWYLNDKRYAQYQKDLVEAINKYLPTIINQEFYKKLDLGSRREAMKEVLDDIKRSVRQEIVAQANVNDLAHRGDIKR